MSNKNKNILLGVLIVGIISMTVAFAALSTRLNINGTAKVSSFKWQIVIDDWTKVNNVASLVSGSTNTAEEVHAGTPTNDTTSVTGLEVAFKKPGDVVKYNFNIENKGTIDAELDSWHLNTTTDTDASKKVTCESNGTSVACPALTISVTCNNEAPVVGSALNVGGSIPCTYTVGYNEVNDTNGYNIEEITIKNLGMSFTYKEKSNSGSTPVIPTKQAITFKVGDLVQMTPAPDTTSSDYDSNGNYIIKGTETGYYTDDTTKTPVDQTINPSELNTWRVIKVNQDGSAEAVSDYVSSTDVYFKGVTGYAKYIGTLNTIASQYENSAYTSGSRYMGYSNQTEVISDTSKFDNTYDVANLGAPWECATGGSCSPAPQDSESLGGGDTGYEADVNLVKAAYNDSLVAYKAGTETAANYWLASRYYSGSSVHFFGYNGRTVSTKGKISYNDMRYYNGSDSSWNDSQYSQRALRPIITLKSGLEGTGTGEDSSPYVLE